MTSIFFKQISYIYNVFKAGFGVVRNKVKQCYFQSFKEAAIFNKYI